MGWKAEAALNSVSNKARSVVLGVSLALAWPAGLRLLATMERRGIMSSVSVFSNQFKAAPHGVPHLLPAFGRVQPVPSTGLVFGSVLHGATCLGQAT